METPAHELAKTRLCRLDGCGNELGADDPKQGRYANICAPCRRGETGPGRAFKDEQSAALSRAAARRAGREPSEPKSAESQAKAERGTLASGTIEAKAKVIVPLARDVERSVRMSKAARSDAARAVSSLSAALAELRDAVNALLHE